MVEHVKVLVDHIEVALEQLFSTALMMNYLVVTITRSTASSWEPERARKGPKGPDEASLNKIFCNKNVPKFDSFFIFR